MIQFSTRAQAMAFLIDILQSMQSDPCGCDLVQGCFCSPDGTVEDHSGMAPCYVCGEWYAEQVYCRDEETMELYQVDGRSWHERGASLRHHVEEARVRRWLDQVVVPPQQQYVPTIQRNISPLETIAPSPRSSPRPPLTRSTSAPASFLIPKEILDPSCRSPGFRIRSKDTAVSSAPICNDASQEQAESSSICFSSGFSFTSERFKIAIQQSMREKPAVSSKVEDNVPKTSSVPVTSSLSCVSPNDDTCGIPGVEDSAAEHVIDSCPSPDKTMLSPLSGATTAVQSTCTSYDHESPARADTTPEQIGESNSLLQQQTQKEMSSSQFDFDFSYRTSPEESSDSPLHISKTHTNGDVSVHVSHAPVTNTHFRGPTSAATITTTSLISQGTVGSTPGAFSPAHSWTLCPSPSISADTLQRTLQMVFNTLPPADSLSSFPSSSVSSPFLSSAPSNSHPWEPWCSRAAGRVK
ncbi:hypothetical protein BGZ49_002188 [Haplosporangium sp. Z 27]|nr:hypothetical protein BGZ49_002188 [Haplosporangium sp. Z 27]